MITNELLPPDLMDIFNESEESDPEHVCWNSSIPYEELLRDFEDRYTRKISTPNIFNNNFRNVSSRKLKSSKSVQTESDVTNIPPSWLLAGEKLVEDLYTGLGNVINLVYHSTEGYIKQGGLKTSSMNPKDMKYFMYQNGYWHSKLLPDIKIADCPEMRSQGSDPCSEDAKKELCRLFEVATKLRNIIPYIANVENSCNHQSIEDEMECSLAVRSTGDLKRSKSPCGGACSCEHSKFDTDLPSDASESKSDSGKSSECSPEYNNNGKWSAEPNRAKRVKKDSLPAFLSRIIHLNETCERNRIPVFHEFRYNQASSSNETLESAACHALKFRERVVKVEYSKHGLNGVEKSSSSVAKPKSGKVLASCSNDFKITSTSEVHQGRTDGVDKTSKDKRKLYEQENYSKGKANSGNCHKNFIRRNIMALKTPSNRAGAVAVRDDPNCKVEESRESNQNNRRQGVSHPAHEYRKFLR